MVDRERNHAKIVNPGVKNAFDVLVDRAKAEGIEMADITGVITGIKFYRDGKYVFASQTNPHHLNFYIRKPARTRWGSLAERAARDFEVARELNGETQIHLKTGLDAQRLVDWLFKLP